MDESIRNTVSCDNAKEQMIPLKNMCWENGVIVAYVAPYTPQQKISLLFITKCAQKNTLIHQNSRKNPLVKI
jgi:hypothetical protein